MSLCNTFRLFGIVCVIMLAIIEPAVIGFTIRRNKTHTNVESDLIAEESSLLEVRNDIIRPNKIELSNVVKKIAPNDMIAKTEEIRNTDTTAENIVIRSSTAATFSGKGNDTQTMKDDAIQLTTEAVTLSSTSDATDEAKRTVNHNITKAPDIISDKSSEIMKKAQILALNNKLYNTTEVLKDLTRHKDEAPSLPTINISDTISIKSTTETTTSMAQTEITDADNFTSYPTAPVKIYNVIEPTISPRVTIVYDSNNKTSTEQLRSVSTNPDTTEIEIANIVTKIEKLSKAMNTSSNTASWKKYTSIERNHITTEKTISTTENLEEMSKADSTQYSVTLKNTLTPGMRQVEKMTSDLLSIANVQAIATKIPGELTSPITETTIATDMISIQAIATLASTETTSETTKLDIVSSKRAGYLNISDQPMTEESTVIGSIANINYTDIFETVAPETKVNISGVDSRRQWVEDVNKEELLREKTFNDNRENSLRSGGMRPEEVKSSNSDINKISSLEYIQMNRENATEDKLNVKSINQDKGKNVSLYVVNPNYKPPKKLEILPAKPFVRNPDDNSWRNESISSLGIIFKAKNSSKPFTQVLRNKTEIEMSNLLEKENKNSVPELRERLEKIAEKRKSKKKKTDSGDIIYTDSEENNSSDDVTSVPKIESSSPTNVPLAKLAIETNFGHSISLPVESGHQTKDEEIGEAKEVSKQDELPETTKPVSPVSTTETPKKFFNFIDYYDTSEDEEEVTLPKIDLKKFTLPLPPQTTKTTLTPIFTYTRPLTSFPADRKPTLEYFPPRATQKVKTSDCNEGFETKGGLCIYRDIPKSVLPVTYPVLQNPTPNHKVYLPNRLIKPTEYLSDVNLNKNLFYANPPRAADHNNNYATVNQDGSFRTPYVIKHYEDYISEAPKDSNYDRNSDYIPSFTVAPIRGVTTELTGNRDKPKPNDEYDYDTQFRKEVLSRFVDNFNQNSERFKVNFPILYNNSVVHKKIDDGKVLSSSSAFLKRLYNDGTDSKTNNYYYLRDKPCDPSCDNVTVDLSPAYELHYYVPEQEEKEEAESKVPVTLRYGYKS